MHPMFSDYGDGLFEPPEDAMAEDKQDAAEISDSYYFDKSEDSLVLVSESFERYDMTDAERWFVSASPNGTLRFCMMYAISLSKDKARSHIDAVSGMLNVSECQAGSTSGVIGPVKGIIELYKSLMESD